MGKLSPRIPREHDRGPHPSPRPLIPIETPDPPNVTPNSRASKHGVNWTAQGPNIFEGFLGKLNFLRMKNHIVNQHDFHHRY